MMFKCQTVSFLEESESGRSFPRRRVARKVPSWGGLQKPQYTVNSTKARQNFRAFSRLLRNTSSRRPCSPTVGHWEDWNVVLTPAIYPWPLDLKLKLDSCSRSRSRSLRKRRSQRQRVSWGAEKQCCPLRSATENGAAKTPGEEEGKRSRRWLPCQIQTRQWSWGDTEAESVTDPFTPAKRLKTPSTSPEQHVQKPESQPSEPTRAICCPVKGARRTRAMTLQRVKVECLWPSSGILTWRAPAAHKPAAGMSCRWCGLPSPKHVLAYSN